MYEGYLTDVKGVKVGHSTNLSAMTGCSVIIFEEGATGGIDVRGSAPGTRETDIFDEKKTVDKIHAVVLSGGSAFGLDSASGVMKYLEESNIGFDVGVTKVPIVPAAVIFDLEVGDYKIRPDKEMGYAAAVSANESENRQGNIGAGAGASVSKLKGMEFAMKGGLGSASLKNGDLVVSALVVVNAVGDVYDYKTMKRLTGVYDLDKNELSSSYDILKMGQASEHLKNKNTTIGIIATNAKLSKSEANKVSEMAHNGLARSINPIHTTLDGDTIFTSATNKVDSDVNIVGTMASEVMSMAITNAIKSAETYKDIIAYTDLKNI